ncbi:LysR family transcriptional regulator [Microbacterium sp. EST19A]|uniref:LysR family transcriptional regulator n=1 Tax=Microbacterium sp. EST19A TaxID=2862681 RepID=UPI001CBAAB9E|nr:LysR substrate-binding domain-containing protein [Microbacterium sp. EST19A]
MEMRHLRYLIAVAEEQSFTRAAERLHVSQPGVSAQVRQLERELGQQLLDRTGRTVVLTAAGETFLPYARAALDAAASGAASVDALTGLIRGHLRLGIGTINSTAFDLPRLLAVFHDEHPGIDITLHEDATSNLVSALHEGHVDAAFLGLVQLPIGEDIRVIELVRDPLVAVLTIEAAQGYSRIPIAALADTPLIAPRSGSAVRELLGTAFIAAGIQPRIVFESGDPNMLVRLSHAGLGTAIVPASVLARYADPRFTGLPLDPHLDARIGLAWRGRGPQSPATGAFIHHLSTDPQIDPLRETNNERTG